MKIFFKSIVTCQILLAVSCNSSKENVTSNGSEEQGVAEAPQEVSPPPSTVIQDSGNAEQGKSTQPPSNNSQASVDPQPMPPPPEMKVNSTLSANGQLTLTAITELLAKSGFSKEDMQATTISLENMIKVAQLKDKVALHADAIDVLLKFASGAQNVRQANRNNNNSQMLPRQVSRRQARQINAQVMTAAETFDLDAILMIIYDQIKPM